MQIILCVVLCGCESWSLTLREERRLSVFENRVQRKVFGAEGEEITGEWRRPHNEELHDLYSSSNIIWVIKSIRMRWTGHLVHMSKTTAAYRVLVGIPDEKRPLGIAELRWEDNIKVDLQGFGGGHGLR